MTTSVKYLDSKIARYDVTYNTSSGNFGFSRAEGWKGFNPSVLTSSVTTQVGGYMAELMTVEHS